jgi:hypothetical protein
VIFHSRKDVKEGWIYRFETGSGRACRAAVKAAQPAVCQTSAGARVLRPRRALSSAEATDKLTVFILSGNGTKTLFRF